MELCHPYRPWAVVVYTICIIALSSCNDDSLSPALAGDETVSGEIVISGDEQQWNVPLQEGAVVSARVEEGDFIVPFDDGSLYVERNDEGDVRHATLNITLSTGIVRRITLAQKPALAATRATSMRAFYRHHALGYSYDALGGEYSNPADIKCQVLNRAVVEQVAQKVKIPFIKVNYQSEAQFYNSVSTSLVRYAQNTNFTASVDADICLFQKSVKKSSSVFEDGQIETYILHNEEVIPKVEYSLSSTSLKRELLQYPQMLTASFRHAISDLHTTLAANPQDFRSIDLFLDAYGTHVVNYAALGAKLWVDVQVSTHRFNDVYRDTVVSKTALLCLFEKASATSKEQAAYAILKDNACRIEVLGGDLSLLDKYVSISVFDNSDVDADALSQWEHSIKFDENDISNSNVELFSIKVEPIWNYIVDPLVSRYVRTRILGDAAQMQELLGNRNFICTTMPAHPTQVTCRIGLQQHVITSNPAVVDIIAANRHVATVCRERVPEISKNEDVFVAYPIYEGHIKLSDGLCIYNGIVYSVDWRYGEFNVSKVGESGSDSIYMNGGLLSAGREEFVKYQLSHLILGMERPGGIGVDGGLSGEYVPTIKYFGHFYLQNKESYDNLPGWDYCKQEPAEKEGKYDSYFPAGNYSNRMVRRDDYIYNYNTKEIGYE